MSASKRRERRSDLIADGLDVVVNPAAKAGKQSRSFQESASSKLLPPQQTEDSSSGSASDEEAEESSDGELFNPFEALQSPGSDADGETARPFAYTPPAGRRSGRQRTSDGDSSDGDQAKKGAGRAQNRSLSPYAPRDPLSSPYQSTRRRKQGPPPRWHKRSDSGALSEDDGSVGIDDDEMSGPKRPKGRRSYSSQKDRAVSSRKKKGAVVAPSSMFDFHYAPNRGISSEQAGDDDDSDSDSASDDDDNNNNNNTGNKNGGSKRGKGRPFKDRFDDNEAAARGASPAFMSERRLRDDRRKARMRRAPDEHREHVPPGTCPDQLSFGALFPGDEDHLTEFKSLAVARNQLETLSRYATKYINAFLNSSGGQILFGVDDDGTVFGLQLDRHERDLVRLRIDAIISSMLPQVDPALCSISFVPVTIESPSAVSYYERVYQSRPPQGVARYVVRVAVKRGVAPVYFTRGGHAFIRRASSTYKMEPSMVAERGGSFSPPDSKEKSAESTNTSSSPEQSTTSSSSSSPSSSSPATTPSSSASSTSSTPTPTPSIPTPSAPPATQSTPSPPSTTTTAVPVTSTLTGAVTTRHDNGEHSSPPRSRPPTVTITGPPVRTDGHQPHFVVGRSAEISQVRAYASAHSRLCLVVLWGSPVVGKSFLAKELAKNLYGLYPDRRMQIDLKGVIFSYVGSTEARLSVIRQVHPMTPIPATEPEILGLYESCFADLRCVLIIENVGSAQQVLDLVPVSAHSLCVIVTTRYDIMLDSITESLCIRLRPLTTDQGRELLANIVGQEFIHSQAPADIDALLAACDGRALLIRLLGAALAREPTSLPRLLASMSNRDLKYDFFARTIPFDGFDPELIQYYLPLGLFRGSFTADAAEAVWGPRPAASSSSSPTSVGPPPRSSADILGDMVGSALLQQLPPNRYQLPDILQVHCTRQAQATVPVQLVEWRKRFIVYFLELLRRLNRLTFEYAQQDAAEIFILEQTNFETAVEYARHIDGFEPGQKMIRSVEWFIKYNLSPCERGTWQSFLHPDFVLTKCGSQLRPVKQPKRADNGPADHLNQAILLDLASPAKQRNCAPDAASPCSLPGPLDSFSTLDLAVTPSNDRFSRRGAPTNPSNVCRVHVPSHAASASASPPKHPAAAILPVQQLGAAQLELPSEKTVPEKL